LLDNFAIATKKLGKPWKWSS